MDNLNRNSYNNVDEVIRVVNNRPKKSEPQHYQEEMRTKSVGKYASKTKNTRHKTTTTKDWRYTAVALTTAASLFIGGMIAAGPCEALYQTAKKSWELHKDTKAYQQMIEDAFTTKTFTGDKMVETDKLARKLEEDGEISNKDLYMTVASLGEVQANQVLKSATNPPATDVETYLRSNNITNTKDWKDKTVDELVARDKIDSATDELEAIFKSIEPTTNSTENIISTEGTYGGK